MAERHARRSGYLGGAILILAGVVFLLANLGYLTLEAWMLLARFWPVLLMLVGLDLLTRGSRQAWVAPATLLVLTAALVFLVLGPLRAGRPLFYGYPYTPWSRPWSQVWRGGASGEERELRRPGLAEARFKLSFGGARVEVRALPDEALLYRLGWRAGGGAPVLARTTWEGNRADVRFYQEHRFPATGRGSRWELALPPGVPLALEIDGGASDLDLDLADLRLRSLSLDLGAGDVELRLGRREPHQKLRLSAGAAQVTVRVPREAGVKVVSRGLLLNSRFHGEGFRKVDGAYVNESWGQATTQVELEVAAGVGELSVETY
ncbi:MAG TPA: hypothetical protein GXX28_09800 [Firmicutes bacterium]|nr:hypothetical protein [Bacillota bacterium]